MARKLVCIIVLYLLLTTYHLLLALEVGIPRGELGLFSQTTKYIYGDYYSSAPIQNIWSSSGTLTQEPLSGLLSGTTSWFIDMKIIPGNTYYYWFQADYHSQRITEQNTLPNLPYHTIYVSTSPGYIIFDGVVYTTSTLITSATAWHNWSSAPPKPTIVRCEMMRVGEAQYETQLEWQEPQDNSGNPILDLFGGGYEIYRSTYSQQPDNMTFLSSFPASAIGNRTYIDSTVTPETPYYYAIRSYDAYIPFLYSDFTPSTTPVLGIIPVYVVFNVDVSKQVNVEKVSIVGNWTNWRKVDMTNLGTGIWQLTAYDGGAKLATNKIIEYRYVINDTIYEPDLDLSEPNRKVTIKISETKPDGKNYMHINDIWGIPTIPAEFNLLEELCSFKISLPTTYYAEISWEVDPNREKDILGFELYKSSDSPTTGFFIIASSSILSATSFYWVDVAISTPPIPYYKIQVVYTSGKKSDLSTALKAGEEIPDLTKYLGVTLQDLQSAISGETGVINLTWTVPEVLTGTGPVTYFIVRRSTFQITNLIDWSKQKIVGKYRAYTSGSKQLAMTQPLGDECPGFYFTIGSIYNKWRSGVALSNNRIGVAAKVINNKFGGIVLKGNKLLGSTTGQSLASMTLDKYSIKSKNSLCVIKNTFEILHEQNTYTKIKEANEKSQIVKILRMIPANEVPSDGLVDSVDDRFQNSTIYEFKIYEPAVGDTGYIDYFADTDSDGKPDRFASRPITVTIPYPDKDNNGIVDGTESLSPPNPIHVSRDLQRNELRLFKLSEVGNFWLPVEDINYSIDTDKKVVVAKIRDLSIYALFGSREWQEDLSKVAVYPNPFKPYDGILENGEYNPAGISADKKQEYESINFVNLTKNAKIFIYNIAAELVFNSEEVSKDNSGVQNGKWRWNAKNSSGEEVSSGVYIYLVKDETLQEGKKNKATGKIVIIR